MLMIVLRDLKLHKLLIYFIINVAKLSKISKLNQQLFPSLQFLSHQPTATSLFSYSQ